jgi:hypothetical protein
MQRIKLEIEKLGVLGENDNDQSINYFEVFFDTVDNNTKVKNSNMILKLIVEGAYSEDDESGALSKLNAIFNWSKEKTSPTNYRTVKVEIFDQTVEKPNRSYEFPDMFVLDYHEIYVVDEEKGSTIKFRLELNQKAGSGLEKTNSMLLSTK